MTHVIPLVISFGGSLRTLLRKAITLSELEGAIFYFDCERAYFLDDACTHREATPEVNAISADIEMYQAYRTLVLAAEAEGRVAWRESGESNTWEQLNELLSRNNLLTIEPLDEDMPQTGRYNYPCVEKAVREQKLPYDVIWTRR